MMNADFPGDMQSVDTGQDAEKNPNNKDASPKSARSYVVCNTRNQYHLIPYVGNKSGFANIFNDLIPGDIKGRRIYDLFGGGGSFSIYSCYRFGSENVTYNDNNPVITNFMKTVRDNVIKLLNEYETHKELSSEEYYYDVRKMGELDKGVVGAGRFLYLAKNAFSGKIRFNNRNKFNSPIRKNSKCPNINRDSILKTSKTIQNMEIKNDTYESYRDVSDAFLYMDPPYMNNSNWHYNSVPETKSFVDFVCHVGANNMIMVSEQNGIESLGLPNHYHSYDVILNRSLQYFTQKNSREFIITNYAKNTES